MRLRWITRVPSAVAPGWSLLDDGFPQGKHALVDLDRVVRGTLPQTLGGRSNDLWCLYVIWPKAGFLPLRAFGFHEVAEGTEDTSLQ